MANNPYNSKEGEYRIEPITLRSVDQAVVDYYTKRLNLSVETADNERFSVPVVFAGSERWKSIRDGKNVRDENGTLILPIISVRRTDIDRDKGKAPFGTEVPSIFVSKRQSAKSPVMAQLAQQRVRNGFPQPKNNEVNEYFSIPFPDFCTVYYEIIIWSQYQSQMNEIIEQLVAGYDYNDTFVMPVNGAPLGKGRYFVGYVDGNFSSRSNTEDMTGDERILKYVFNIKVPVSFVLSPKSEPTAYGKDKGRKDSANAPIIYKQESVTQVLFTEGVDVSALKDKTRDVFYSNAGTNADIALYAKAPSAGNTSIGAVGPPGPAGSAGPQGPAGPPGPSGSAGVQGIQGPVGPSGSVGPAGPSGSAGVQGIQGASGSVGPAGPSGSIGPQGIQGPSGPQGIQGDTGPSGSAGIDGRTVLNGTSVPSNAIGANGDFYFHTLTANLYGPKTAGVWSSYISLIGPSGSVGSQGVQGPSGSMGPQGVPGNDGAIGPSGSAGAQGAPGPSGSVGPSGSTGLVPFDQFVAYNAASGSGHQLFWSDAMQSPDLGAYYTVGSVSTTHVYINSLVTGALGSYKQLSTTTGATNSSFLYYTYNALPGRYNKIRSRIEFWLPALSTGTDTYRAVVGQGAGAGVRKYLSLQYSDFENGGRFQLITNGGNTGTDSGVSAQANKLYAFEYIMTPNKANPNVYFSIFTASLTNITDGTPATIMTGSCLAGNNSGFSLDTSLLGAAIIKSAGTTPTVLNVGYMSVFATY